MIKKIILSIIITCIASSNALCREERLKERSSTHFIVYYKDAPKEFIDSVIDSAEDYYHSITRELGLRRTDFWLWDDRGKIYIHSDREDYIASSGQPHWSAGSALFEEKTIHTYPMASGFFDTLLPHELGHIIFREFIGFRRDIPTWCDEGVAMYQEKARRWGSKKIVQQAIEDGTFMTLDELTAFNLRFARDEKKVTLFYNEATSIIYFLLKEHGRNNFIEFCRGLRDGKEFEEAFDDAYVRFDSIEDLNTAWMRYLKE
ncbi:peptidase MA family metallohydrolase [Candidatus Omnitrophota bacterium]